MTRTGRPARPLPPLSAVSPAAAAFLNAKLASKEDLYDRAPTLVSDLRTRCETLDQSLSDLSHQLRQFFSEYSSHSDKIGALFDDIGSKLSDLQSSTLFPTTSSDGGSGRILGEELPALAKEVARVEAVRSYAGQLHH